jgi:myo-inositol-1(or 4)-monophosphatase
MNRLETAIKAAVSAGDLLINHYGKIYKTNNKESLRDVVSEIDKLSESKVIAILQDSDPGSTILSEEKGLIGQESDSYWIVDALDGTVNYIHNIPFFCVSISYWFNNRPLIGVIYNPYSSEIYYAERGVGCFINQKRLQLQDSELSNNLTAMAFSGKKYNPSMRPTEFRIFGQLNDLSQGCLRTGSAAMNLGYLSNGKFSLVIGKANKLWDVAAGLLIAKEAGADVKFNITDKQKHLVDYIAATPLSQKKLFAEIDVSYFDLKLNKGTSK